MICVLHQPELALRHAHRIIGLKHGRLIFNEHAAQIDADTVAELYRVDED